MVVHHLHSTTRIVLGLNLRRAILSALTHLSPWTICLTLPLRVGMTFIHRYVQLTRRLSIIATVSHLTIDLFLLHRERQLYGKLSTGSGSSSVVCGRKFVVTWKPQLLSSVMFLCVILLWSFSEANYSCIRVINMVVDMQFMIRILHCLCTMQVRKLTGCAPNFFVCLVLRWFDCGYVVCLCSLASVIMSFKCCLVKQKRCLMMTDVVPCCWMKCLWNVH